ncbi:MAG: O-antigen ligase family protein [Candidatus Omnitrophica bacterium]|nr:O-antigen ligase family protein [Candidatus Omnitrophota bacterium]
MTENIPPPGFQIAPKVRVRRTMREILVSQLSSTKEAVRTIQYFIGIFLFVGLMMASFSFKGQAVFAAIIIVPPIFAYAMGTRKAYLFIMYYLFITFSIGQRTMFFGKYFRVVPCEILVVALAIVALFVRLPVKSTRAKIPKAVYILALSSAWAVLNGWYVDSTPDEINQSLFYAKMMWIAIPCYIVVRRMVHEVSHVQNILTIMATVCLFLSILSISEYMGLGYVKIFGGYLQEVTTIGEEGFKRAGAAFWGNAMLAGFLAIWFPLIFAELRNSRTNTHRFFLFLSFIFTAGAIYISGHRGVWVPSVISFVAYFSVKGIRFFVMAVIGLMCLYYLAPQVAKDRMHTIYGEKQDSSAKEREARAKYAWSVVQNSPILGNGWGSSGLVHSDILQIWADVGIFGMLAYLSLFLSNVRRLWSQYRKTKSRMLREYFCGFVGSTVAALAILTVQPFFNLPEQYAPFWAMMALAYFYASVVLAEKRAAFEIYKMAGKITPGTKI